ncbi:MAG: MAE_28990/MAE_18760 family HEPN-like nuclease [Cyclobacteriaceae bacterium]
MIRTLDDLSRNLSDQLAWRKKELSEIKYLVESKAIAQHKKNVFLRSSVAMIYAHWEGFLKLSGSYYLEYVYNQRLKNSDLSKNFLTMSLSSFANIFDNTKKYSHYGSVIDFFDNELNSRSKIPYKSTIDTESNLSSKVLREIVWCLGLSYQPFEIKEKIIDNKLLAKRNHIAHGEYLDVEPEDIIELRNEILALMINFKNQIENAALLKNYIKIRNTVPNNT